MSSLKMKKFVNIKGVIDNIRQSVNTPSPTGGGTSASGPVKLEQDAIETLNTDQFTLANTVRHGFPFKPISVAYDPVQKLLAIGNRTGVVRIYGRPGIDLELVHENETQVFQIIFLINSGTLLTACTDDTINLWDFKKKTPELVQSLKFNKERLTMLSIEFQDKWLYLGTEKGNVYIMNIELFQLSGYHISWNKAIDPLQKTHPGGVMHISLNPADNSKLLLGFETGLICLWDLATKKGEQRYNYNQRLYSVCWHMEGRQFVCSYGDGSLVTWNIKPTNNKPSNVVFPHGKKNKDTNKIELCDPIDKVFWRVNRSGGESYFIFSGGLPQDITGTTPSITVMQGKQTTVLEMEYCVLDFLLVTDSPYASDYQEPEAVIAMLTNDLVAIDCKSSGYPCFKNPYAMDFNESPVTCCRYLVDCPGDLIPALYMVGSKAKKEGSNRGFSTGEWPISGGLDTGTEACSYTELVITGHADGTVRFWDSSSTSMQSLYRIKTGKLFEKQKKNGLEGLEDDPYAVSQVDMCMDTRLLAVSGASSHVVLFKFKKKETNTETVSLEIPIIYEVSSSNAQKNSDQTSPRQHFEFPPRPLLNVASQSSSYTDPVDGFNFDKPSHEYFSPLRLRTGAQRKTPGYHAELVCFTPWVNGEAPGQITCLTLNSNYGLMAYGNASGLVIIDIIQNVCLLNMGTADLYGSLDPFHRMPKSPKPLSDAPPEIVRVDLNSYSQISATPPAGSEGEPPAPVEKPSMLDTMSVPAPPRPGLKSPAVEGAKRLVKASSSADDSSLSKSLSSSSTSLDQVITGEGVTSVDFVDSFTSKGEYLLSPSLYVGTTLGSILVICVNLPDRGDPRHTEPVVVSPSGSLYRLRGSVITTCFLDCSTSCLSIKGEPLENVKLPSRPHNATQNLQSSQSVQSSDSVTPGPTGDQMAMMVCTEKVAAVFALPSQRQMYSQSINESSSVVSAEIINFGGPRYTPCLVAYTADGQIKAYSLPSLRPMLDQFLIPNSPRVGITMRFSNKGHALYFCNPTELQKFTISSEFKRQFPEMTGILYQDSLPMPDPPKQGFLKGLFGGGPKPLDREELFGESAGKQSSTVAKHIPGANMQTLQGKGVGAMNDVAKAKMAMIERGQKLSELEDRTEQMSLEAKQYAASAQRLKDHYKGKKWYQI